MKKHTKKELIALISEHENDYWNILANNWTGAEELAETIENIRNIVNEQN
jgi:hypothetical protein